MSMAIENTARQCVGKSRHCLRSSELLVIDQPANVQAELLLHEHHC